MKDASMIRVLLVHGASIPHYRVPIYGHLAQSLGKHGFELQVASEGIQPGNPHEVAFPFEALELSASSIGRLVRRRNIDVVIMFVDMRHLYLFPTYLVVKGLLRRRMVWWGQGRDLASPDATVKNLAYGLEHALCDAIILYARHLEKYIALQARGKVFVANNTLVIDYQGLDPRRRGDVLAKHGIHTPRNIICVGRIQRRKRLDRLVVAHAAMKRDDVGLILVGPDTEGILDTLTGDNVFRLGAIYGDDKFDLMSAADVYCLPGAVGLSIVDAFHCGLPLVTEAGDESAEMMYLKDGENGFIVPRGDATQLRERLLQLLDDDALRTRFSEAARREIRESGSIDAMAGGFLAALQYATRGLPGRGER